MRTISKLLLGLAAATAASGCSWAAFDDLADETWVDRAGAPSGVSSNLFGEQVAASGVRGPGGTFLVLGRNNASVGKISYDDNGVKTQIDGGAIGNTFSFAAFQEHPAMAGDPTSTKVAFALVTLNGDDANSNTKFVFYDTTSFMGQQIEAPPVLKGKQRVNGLAFEDVDHDGTRDLIAARTDQAMIITDWDSPEGQGAFAVTACLHGEENAYGITSTDFDGDSIPEIVLAAGATDRAGSSNIFIFEPSGATQYNGTLAAAPGSCFTPDPALATISKVGANVHDLGAQLGIIDEGMGPWVVATSPLTNQVFVFQNPTSVDMTEIDIPAPAGAGAFGESLAIGDLNGDGKPELVVGAPRSTVNGQANAGAVYIYQFDGTTFKDPIELHDASPEAEQHFGKSVAVVPFGTGNRSIVVAGADGETFAYFRTTLYLDVRAGHQ